MTLVMGNHLLMVINTETNGSDRPQECSWDAADYEEDSSPMDELSPYYHFGNHGTNRLAEKQLTAMEFGQDDQFVYIIVDHQL